MAAYAENTLVARNYSKRQAGRSAARYNCKMRGNMRLLFAGERRRQNTRRLHRQSQRKKAAQGTPWLRYLQYLPNGYSGAEQTGRRAEITR